jgi:hypothetical protein
LFQRYNQISSTLSGGPKRYAPIFMRTDDEEVLLEQYANGFWFGMQLTLDKWKPFLADRQIGMALVAILGHCTTMPGHEEQMALLPPQGTELLRVLADRPRRRTDAARDSCSLPEYRYPLIQPTNFSRAVNVGCCQRLLWVACRAGPSGAYPVH